MLDSISDKDVLEDTDSNDEFEKKFEDSVQAHKEASSRPSSSSSRPKTATRYREDSESRTNLLATAIIQVYMRLSKFVSSRQFSKADLVSQFGEYATAERFREVFSDLGFEINDAELNFIFRDSGVPRTGVIRMADFYTKIIAEAQEEEEETPKGLRSMNAEQLRREAEKLLMETSPKGTKRRKRSKEKSLKSVKRTNSGISRSTRPPSAPNSRKEAFQHKSYLRESQVKKVQEMIELENTVDRCRREFEFDCIKKMGEANDILQSQASDKNYRCIRKDDKMLKCHIYSNEKFLEEISLENFLRKWKKLKNHKNKAPDVTASQVTSKSMSTINAKVNKNERQEELKKLLLETRELTNSLKQQMKVLEQKGIIRREVKKESFAIMNSRM